MSEIKLPPVLVRDGETLEVRHTNGKTIEVVLRTNDGGARVTVNPEILDSPDRAAEYLRTTLDRLRPGVALNPTTPATDAEFQTAVRKALTSLLYAAAGNEDDEDGPSLEDVARSMAPNVAAAIKAAAYAPKDTTTLWAEFAALAALRGE